jgi:hypothetical protein
MTNEIPETHRLTDLETKLLETVQALLMRVPFFDEKYKIGRGMLNIFVLPSDQSKIRPSLRPYAITKRTKRAGRSS